MFVKISNIVSLILKRLKNYWFILQLQITLWIEKLAQKKFVPILWKKYLL